jgi:LysM repeat protein
MSYRRTTTDGSGSILRAILLTLLFIVIFLLTLIIALFLLLGPNFELSQLTDEPSPQPVPTATINPEPLVTPIAASLTTVRNVALGFAMDYPANWQKRETTLRVILAPDSTGLFPEKLQGAAIWAGIPADDSYEPTDLLTDILADFPANTDILNTGTLNVGAQSWQMIEISFENEEPDQSGHAILAATNRNNVGYILGVTAPADQWDTLQPVFRGILNSFRFTEEAVIRPTDATRPPTPTPTPTPQVYIVQSGDTLSHIAVKFGVTVEALSLRNNIDDPRSLQTGQRLVIPTKRKRY